MFNNIEVVTFASVFHGIRFKVRRLFVGTTSNFFCPYEKAASPQFHNDCFMEKNKELCHQGTTPVRSDVWCWNDGGVFGKTACP
jgi:AraC-like DNA-binding protein